MKSIAFDKMFLLDGKPHSMTHFMASIILLYFGILAILGAFYLFFATFDLENFIVAGYIILTCSFILGVVALLKWLSVFIHKKCEAKKSTQIRNEILIGLVGIVICGIVPRILVFFVKYNNDLFLCFTLSLGFVSIALYYLFVHECDENYESNPRANSNVNWNLFAVHVAVLMIIAKFTLTCDFSTNKKMEIFVYQFIVGLCYAPTTFDLYGVLSGLRKLKDVDGMGQQPAGNTEYARLESAEKVKAEGPRLERETCKNQQFQAVQTHPKIDCKVCRLEYSDIRIPRNLKECGHTICEDCADTLLKKNQMHFLFCPFCKIATAVNGPASSLQKNYAVLEIINNLKN